MHPPRNPGRVAGLWYLLLIALGPVFLIYVPGKLFVKGNAPATISNIAAHQWLFRIGILGELFGAIVLIFLVLALYRLFRAVDQHLGFLVILLGGVIPAALYFVNSAIYLAVLELARGGADFLSVFDNPQRDAVAMLLLRLHHHETTASLVLAGVWLFPLATLVYRSHFLPRFLGIWLALGGFAWLLLSLTAILAPQYQDRLFSILQPAFFGEIALMLWLVIKGANPPPPALSL